MIHASGIAGYMLLCAGTEISDEGVAVCFLIFLVLEGSGQGQIRGKAVTKAKVDANHGGVVKIALKTQVPQVVDVFISCRNQGRGNDSAFEEHPARSGFKTQADIWHIKPLVIGDDLFTGWEAAHCIMQIRG